jgi:hypothetical protein
MILCVSERANGDISIPSFPDTACHRRSSLGRRWFVLPGEARQSGEGSLSAMSWQGCHFYSNANMPWRSYFLNILGLNHRS